MKIERLMIAPEILINITSGLFQVVGHALPEDARLVQATIDPTTGCIMLFIASETFEPIPYGEVPPLVPAPIISRVEAR